jgi:hypothetical protein
MHGLILVALVAAAVQPTNAKGDWDLASAVQNCGRQGDMKQLMQWVSAAAAPDADLAARFVSYLDGGTRWFEKGGNVHADPLDAVSLRDGTVLITYRRDGTRWGWAGMAAYRVGDYAVLLCDWRQQSRKHDQHLPVPPIPIGGGLSIPGFNLDLGGLWSDDHGGCIYVFRETQGGFIHVAGTGCDYGDGATNPNWLTGNNGQ